MQRVISTLIFLGLFALGAYAVATGFAAPTLTYQVPADPMMATILVVSLVGVLVLTVVAGGGLAFLFNFVGTTLEKEKPGAPAKANYGNSPVAPYVQDFSKPSPENVENRNWLIGSAGFLIFLAVWVLTGNGRTELTESAAKFGSVVAQMLSSVLPANSGLTSDVLAFGVSVGLVLTVLGSVVAVGAGLAFWFFRTTEEQAKTAKEPPMWPATELQALEQKLKSPEQLLPKNLTLFDKAVLGLDVALIILVLGVVVAWVLPAVSQVVAVDAAMQPTAVPRPTAAVVAAKAGPSDELKKEFEALPKGDAVSGAKLFTGLTPPCSSCHTVTGEAVIVGPAQAGVGNRAGSRKPGYSAEIYLYESIVSPSAYLVTGFQDGLMPKTFKETLKPQEMADLIAYLASLK